MIAKQGISSSTAKTRLGVVAGVAIGSAAFLAFATAGPGRAASARATPVIPAQDCDAALLSASHLQDTTIKAVTLVDAGAAFTPPSASRSLSDLPAFCRVTGVATPTPDSVINFELWIPLGAKWNHKFVATGNGGYSSVISFADMADALRQGYATVGSDTGHQGDDLLFGISHPEKIIDWGTRSVHAASVSSKQIITRLRGAPPRRAYYIGCSTGGHQGYAEVQRYPDDFDGVIAGDPGNNRTALNVEFMWRYLANHPSGDDTHPILTPAVTAFVTRKAVAACDKLDGVEDKVIGDPRLCTIDKFDVGSLACKAGQSVDCLTPPLLDAVRKIYAGPKNPRTGEQIYPGLVVGSEAGWNSYLGTTEPTRANFWRYWVFNNPNYSWWTFDFDRDYDFARAKVGDYVDQTNSDISAFKAHGGKLITYQGWADPVVNPLDTIAYYENVRRAQGSQAATDQFFRLFMVPGMGHCRGGAGVEFSNPPGQPLSPDNSLLVALDNWVENRRAPTRFTGSRVANGELVMTRPICAYPLKAIYSGSGDTTRAEDFRCA